MTKDEINRTIAEVCGWRQDGSWWVRDDLRRGWIEDYFNDLNAMHEAEKYLPYDPEFRYEKQLHRVSNGKGERATASQRAVSFLMQIGKWTQ